MNRMFALAEEGHEVSFRNEETASRVVSTKDVVTYSTKDRDKAFAWADAMVEEGYTVTVRFDENTGIYTCYAIKKFIANRLSKKIMHTIHDLVIYKNRNHTI